MNKQINLLLLLTCIAFGLNAQDLKTFTVTLKTDSLCYLSFKNKKAYTAADAAGVKDVLDIGFFSTVADKTEVLEWYNLKPDNDKAPPPVTGTKTGIAAISFDRDQFDKCKTAADLRRMTGHISKNSLSHFAVIRNSPSSYQRCFIAETTDGRRALVYVTLAADNRLTTEVKSE